VPTLILTPDDIRTGPVSASCRALTTICPAGYRPGGANVGNVYLIARVGLAAVFAVSAVGKLSSLERTRRSLAGFGMPAALLAPASIALVLAEGAVAVLLVAPATAVGAAIGAAALMLIFVLAIVRAIARGERPDCNCFGQVHSRPVGWATVGRDVAIAAVAMAIAAGGPGASLGPVLSGVDLLAAGAVGVLVVVLIGLTWFSFELFRQNGRLLARIEALEEAGRVSALEVDLPPLPVGAPAPAFALPDLEGARHSLAELLAANRPMALTFVDPECGACWSLLPRLARLRLEQAGGLGLVVISRGDPEVTRGHVNGHELGPVLMQEAREVADAYRVNGVPSMVLVTPDGRLGSPPAVGELSIERLIGARDRTAAPTATGWAG
jgi:uncharacterized membrane protein YphA (DoxX/SURF4 family)